MKRVYYGWWVVAFAFALNMTVYGTTYNAFQLFVVPASKEYGLSRAQMNTAMVLFNIGSALTSPFIGRLLDLFSPKKILIAGILLLGATFAMLGLTHAVWLGAALFAGPLAIALLLTAHLTGPQLVNNWFSGHRGRAQTLAYMGVSFGLTLTVPLVGVMIAHFGWRPTLLILAVGVTSLLLVLTIAVRERPAPGEAEGGHAVDAAPVEVPAGEPLKLAAILAMPQFWTIAAANALAAVIASTLAVSLVPIGISRGLSPVAAAGLVSISGIAAIAAKLLLAAISDKMSRILLLVALFLLAAAGNAAMLTDAGQPALFACAASLGISSGAFSPLIMALIGDRFGKASFGTVFGLLVPFSVIPSALSMRMAGEVFDRTGSYLLIHQAFVVFGLLAAAIMFATRFTRPVAPPVPA